VLMINKSFYSIPEKKKRKKFVKKITWKNWEPKKEENGRENGEKMWYRREGEGNGERKKREKRKKKKTVNKRAWKERQNQ